MANFAGAAALRKRLGLDKSPDHAPFPERPEPFTKDDWTAARRTREAIDVLEAHHRWVVTLIPSDGLPRHYFLRGTLPAVTERARHFFPEHLRSLTIELAGVGGEVIDTRLTNIGENL